MFSTFDNLQQHLDAERRVFMEEQDTAYDMSKIQHMTSLRRGPAFSPVSACKSKVQCQLLKNVAKVPLHLEKPSKQ